MSASHCEGEQACLFATLTTLHGQEQSNAEAMDDKVNSDIESVAELTYDEESKIMLEEFIDDSLRCTEMREIGELWQEKVEIKHF